MQRYAAGGTPQYDLRGFATALVGLRPLLVKPILTPLFVLESCTTIDDPGDEPSYLAVVPHALRIFNPLNWPLQSDGTQHSDGEVTVVAESTAECTSCSVDVEPEVVIEQEKSSSSGIVQEAVVTDIRPDSLWSIGTIGEGRGKRVAHGLLPTTSKEALQFDISEEDKPAVALPKYDNRELEPELSWHHSGMYLNREPPETRIPYTVPAGLPSDTTAVYLPGMRARLFVKHVSLVVEVPAYTDEIHAHILPTVEKLAAPLNPAATVADATFGDARANHDSNEFYFSPAPQLNYLTSPRQVTSHKDLNPYAQEFIMPSPSFNSYAIPELPVDSNISSEPHHQRSPYTLQSALELLSTATLSPKPVHHVLELPHDEYSPSPSNSSSSLLAILSGQRPGAYDLSPTPLLPAISLSPRTPIGSPHQTAHSLRSDFQDNSPLSDTSVSLLAILNGSSTDTSFNGPIIPSGPADRISSPDDPPLVRPTPVGARTPPRRPWYIRPDTPMGEIAPPWPPVLSRREQAFSLLP